MFKPIDRNYDGIQFEDLRRVVDPPFGEFHDQLSAAYYNSEVLKHSWLTDWGYPGEIDFKALKQESPGEAKDLFNELHALQDLKRQEHFHRENLRQPENIKIPEEEYNIIFDEQGKDIGKVSDRVSLQVGNIINRRKLVAK